jgi:hypothetical protein
MAMEAEHDAERASRRFWRPTPVTPEAEWSPAIADAMQ